MTFLSKIRFFFSPTVDSVLTEFSETGLRLDSLAVKYAEDHLEATQKAAYYGTKATEYARESQRASTVADRIRALIA